jgi:hypothetical protein
VGSHGISGCCAIGSLVLEYCLHGIKAEAVKGYMVIGDKYWILHIWNKIYLAAKEHQIDILKNPAKETGLNV